MALQKGNHNSVLRILSFSQKVKVGIYTRIEKLYVKVAERFLLQEVRMLIIVHKYVKKGIGQISKRKILFANSVKNLLDAERQIMRVGFAADSVQVYG